MTIDARLFLVGCPRSGTTLLQSLLAAHPRLASFPETHAFAHLLPRARPLRALRLSPPWGRPRLRKTLAELGDDRPLRLAGWWAPAAARRVIAVLDAAALERGRSKWLEKTPRHLHYIEEIERWVPRSSFVHLVRDGAEVVASLVRVTREAPEVWRGARSLETCLARWVGDVSLTARHAGRPGHVVVLYDELARDPERLLRYLCPRLGLDYDPAMLTGYARESVRLVRPGETWKLDVAGEIAPRSPRRFGELFSPEEEERIRTGVEPLRPLLEGWRRDYLAASTAR